VFQNLAILAVLGGGGEEEEEEKNKSAIDTHCPGRLSPLERVYLDSKHGYFFLCV
jgi:hypothetical protein